MIRRVGARLGILAASLLAASVLIFVVCSALPGDVASVILGEGATPDQLATLRHQLGTDRPLPVQYLSWASGMLQGDFGRSYLSGDSVASLLGPRLAVTFWLVTFSLILALLVALPTGMYAALRRRHWDGFIATALAQIGMAIPAFWAGLLLVAVFAVGLHWLPANGYVPFAEDPGSWAAHLVLPVLALGLIQGAMLTRYVRSAFIDVLNEDYFRTARAVGWTQGRAMVRHGLRNASLSLVTVLGLQLSSVLVGAIVIESVFALPGLGTMLLQVVTQHDLQVVQGTVMFLVAVVLVVNALVDVSYLIIDPRLRGERE
ncbi:MAG: ABC transporter permease [Propionibacteriaceae bacterium]